jgi:hypothetical protein
MKSKHDTNSTDETDRTDSKPWQTYPHKQHCFIREIRDGRAREIPVVLLFL